MRLRSLCLSLVLLSVVLGHAESARAQARLVINQPRYDRQIELNVRVSAYYGYEGFYDGLGYAGVGGYAAGPGIQMLFPIVKNAIPTINNPMYLGFFTDFMFHPVPGYTFYSLAFGPVFQWRFVIFDMFQSGSFSAFANLGFGLWPWFWGNYYGGGAHLFGFPLFQLGGQIMFTRRIGLTLQFGYPSVNFGLNIGF